MESEAANADQLVASKERTISAVVVGQLVGAAAVMSIYLMRVYNLASIDEDAYISFRYARNLISGEGLVFNPGERVEGITNLLWTLLIAAASRISGVSLPTIALVLGGLCGALTMLVAYRWCRKELVSVGVPTTSAAYVALVVPLLLALAPGFAAYAVSGLETPLFTLLVTGGLYLLSRTGTMRSVALGSVLLGAAAMTRPEGALFIMFGGLACALRPGPGRGARAVASVVPGLAIVLTLIFWRLWYYGSLVPNTFFAKAGGKEIMWRWGLPYVQDAAMSLWLPLALLLILGGAVLNRGFLFRSIAVLVALPAWCAYVTYVGGDYMPFFRFFVPLLPAAYVFAVPGFAVALTAFGAVRGVSMSARIAVAAAGIGAFVATSVMQFPDQFRAEADNKAESTAWYEHRVSAAQWLNSQEPEILVAANAVGALGYHSDVRVLDMLGLNDPHIARYGQRDPESFPGHQVGDGEYVLSREPDYIIPFSVKPEFQWSSTPPYFIGDKELAALPEFQERYELRVVELGDGQKLSVFKREGISK